MLHTVLQHMTSHVKNTVNLFYIHDSIRWDSQSVTPPVEYVWAPGVNMRGWRHRATNDVTRHGWRITGMERKANKYDRHDKLSTDLLDEINLNQFVSPHSAIWHSRPSVD